jgi:glycosyltransferase involved in cell wall biosynthesis
MTPTILMLTPVMPSPTGGGSLIRAAAILESLARIGRVVVVHVECWGATANSADRSWCRGKAAAMVVMQPGRLGALPDVVLDAMQAAGLGDRIDAMYVFRQIVGPAGLACRERFAPRISVLDLDDDECALDRFLVALHRERGDSHAASALESGQDRRRMMRDMLLRRFDRVFLSNPADVQSMRRETGCGHIGLLPNVIGTAHVAEHVQRDACRMLFLGTLSYLPNEDGLAWFIREVLPRARAIDPRMSLRVAGVGSPDGLSALLSADGVDFAGEVPDVAPEHAAAGMLVVPLRAGSGTRIKILEAFSYGTPVVSTTIGAAGLDVTDGQHLLFAESPDAFAQSCVQLAHDAPRRAALARSASQWVATHHSADVMHRILAEAIMPHMGMHP